jgi:hypothetical protein
MPDPVEVSCLAACVVSFTVIGFRLTELLDTVEKS